MANPPAIELSGSLSPYYSASQSDSNMPTPLFEIVGVHSRFVIENVYLNGLHALRRLVLKNVSSHRILIKMRSNLGSQIAFQLKNENLLDDDEPLSRTSSNADDSAAIATTTSQSLPDSATSSPDLSSASLPSPGTQRSLTLTTNTVAAAAVGSFSDRASSGHFNQLFNFVNHIDEIELAPGQSRKIILAFLPDARRSVRRPTQFGVGGGGGRGAERGETSAANGGEGGDEESPESASTLSEQTDEDETHNTFDINGLLSFLGYILDKGEGKNNDGPADGESACLSTNVGLVSGNGRQEDVLSREGSFSSSSLQLDTIDPDVESEPQVDQQLTIKFRSTVCRTVLWTDVGETGITFDDCVIGGTYFKDFTIWNRSEIELYWLLNTVDLSNTQHEDWLRFTDYDTGELLNSQPISSYSHRRVRVTFKPKEIGEFNYDLQMENANDASNVELTRVHAVVRSVPREESLVVSSGNVLDFGDCCAGVWSFQQLVLKNISEEVVEVHFSAENAEVFFDLKTGFEANADGLGFHGDAGTPTAIFPNRFLKEMSLANNGTSLSVNTTTSVSEVSAAESDVSSRASSPTPVVRYRDTEPPNSPSSFDLNFATSVKFPGSSRIGSQATPNEESDSEEGEGMPSDKRPVYNRHDTSNSISKAGSLTRIEDLILKSGTERTVQVSYRPEKDHSAGDFKAGQLIRRNFRIHLSYSRFGSNTGKERKVIQCKARSCTSFVEVSPKELNFGDTDVGTLKSMLIHIANRSELTARVELQFTSKVLNCHRSEIVISPKQSTAVKLDMYPRKVNPEYRKQITVVNMQNRDNDQIIEVRSTNIDKNRVTFHSLFYRILTTTGANFIDFGSIVLNSPAVRTFTIDNISERKLVLEVTSSLPEDIVIYTRKKRDAHHFQSNPGQINGRTDTADDQKGAAGNSIEYFSEMIGDSQIPFRQRSLDTVAALNASPTVAALIAPSVFGDNTGVFTRHRHHSRERFKTRIDRSSTDTAYLDLAVPNAKDGPRRKLHARTFQTLGVPKSVKTSADKLAKNGGEAMGAAAGSKDDDRARVSKFNSNVSNSSTSNARVVELTRGRSSSGDNDFDSIDAASESSERRSLDLDNGPRGISAARGKSKKNVDWASVSAQTQVSFDVLITALEQNTTNTAPLFPRPTMEDKYVRQKLALRRKLDGLINNEILVPVSLVEVAPRSEEDVVVIFTPNGSTKPHILGIPKKHDARIFLRLVEFDRTIEQTQFESLLEVDQTQIPLRELLVRSTLCRSIMELGQKNINFGMFERNERRAKSIIIQNRSEAPLLYHIRKSGSISSGYISLGSGKYGVVRGYAKKEVEFVFDPSLPGQFVEKLVVENIQDRDNDQVLSVKASIRKPSTFYIKSLALNFGACLIDQQCLRVEKVVLTNTSKQARTFEIRFESQEMRFEWCVGELDFLIEDEDNIGSLTMEAEEEIETLEQKMKIAKRKGHKDKILQYEKKLTKLKNGATDEQQGDGDENGKGRDDGKLDEAPTLLAPEEELSRPDAAPLEPAHNDTMATTGIPSPLGDVGERGVSSEPIVRRKSLGPSGTKEIAFKYRKTPNSIIFPLEARATRTVSVYFKPSLMPPDSLVNEDEHHEYVMPTKEVAKGSLLVHEHKNTDDLKEIIFNAVVCYDHPSYLEALAEDTDRRRELERKSSKEVDNIDVPLTESKPCKESNDVTRTPGGSRIWSPEVIATLPPAIDYSARLAQARSRQMTGEVISADDAPIVEPLAIERPDLDVGRVEVNRRAEFYLRLINRTGVVIDYEFVVLEDESSFFDLPHRAGVLSPNAVQQIHFGIFSTKIGKQSHRLLVRDLRTHTEIVYTLRCLAHYRRYLRFPSVGDDNQNQLDLGCCYVDPGSKYSQVTPLLVENLTDEDLYITCQSNLSLQVCIFVDERCERGQVELSLLKRRSMMTVWVALRPNLLGGLLGTSRRIANQAGGVSSSTASSADPAAAANLELLTPSSDECRELVGGIKFSVFTKDNVSVNNAEQPLEEKLVQMISQTVKFNALIGQANLVVSDRIIQLGVAESFGDTFYGHFTVTNMSGRLPLNYAVECPRGNIILDRTRGTLEGWNRDKIADSAPPSPRPQEGIDYFQQTRARAQVSFRVTPTEYGFFSDKIIVTNKNNSTQVFEIEVRLFVDGGHLKCNTHLPIADENFGDGFWPSTSVEKDDVSDPDRSHKDTHRLPVLTWNEIYVLIEEHTKDGEISVEDVEDANATNPRKTVILPALYNSDPDFARDYQRCLEIENTTSETMHLIPRSNLGTATSWVCESGTDSTEMVQHIEEPDAMFARCGTSFDLSPNQLVTLRIACPTPPKFDDDQCSRITSGKKIAVSGSLLLEDASTNRILKMFDLVAWYCSSVGKLDIASVDVGKVGYSNSWKKVGFSFNLRNQSEIPLQYCLRTPATIKLVDIECDETEDDGTRVFDRQVAGVLNNQIIQAVLEPRSIADFTPGPREFLINILNLLNPNNMMTLSVTAHLTTFELRFERLSNGELILPSLSHPLPTSDLPCDNWFSIVNTTDDEIRFQIGVELAPELTSLIKVDVLSRFSNSPLKSGFPLNPRGKMEVRIRAHPVESSRLPPDSAHLTDHQGILLGKLWVTTNSANREEGAPRVGEEIPIRGVITEVPIYSLSERRLEFKNVVFSSKSEDSDGENIVLPNGLRQQSSRLDASITIVPQFETVTISNLSQKLPLHFKATVELPPELRGQQLVKLSPLDDEGCGTVEPSGRLALQVRIVEPKPGTSGDIKLHVQDLHSFSGRKQSIFISLLEDHRDTRKLRKAVTMESDDYSQGSLDDDLLSIPRPKLSPDIFQQTVSVPPIINLRGCKRIGDTNDFGERFELDLGQQDLNAPNVAKKIILENPMSETILYRIKTVSEADKTWLKLNRTDGTLDPSSGKEGFSEAHTITLTLSTTTRNVYSTYLIIENVNNPADTKTIRVIMEVVARQNLRRGQAPSILDNNNRVFDVYVNGVDTSQTCIEMLNIFYGSEYTARSIVIYNRETVPLEFTLMSNLAHDDPTEILFSTSRMSSKLFKSLTVDPCGHVRVYIRFRPEPSPGVQQALDREQHRDPNTIEEKIVEIYVNCRLVKDYQQIVVLKAECRVPAFRVKYSDTEALMGTIKRRSGTDSEEEEWQIEFVDEARPLDVFNIFADELHYEIVNDTTYFLLEFPSKSKSIPPRGTHKIKVMPNMKALIKNADSLWREKYIQENITVYNRKRPQENYWIPLRISFGHISNFQLASGYRSSWAYSMLENHVVRFLSDFNGNIRAFSAADGNDNELQVVSQKLADLEFQYYYIVDQLVYYSTVKTGENFFQLASLLFGTLLGNDLFKKHAPSLLRPLADKTQQSWPPMLAKWVFPLHYYLSFFPYRPPMLETLHNLHRTLIAVGSEATLPPRVSSPSPVASPLSGLL
ncbi:hypothetical protein BC938DRAFT_478418 [Jimgerdemannia flammicorona]|uniref:Uncharacterized protein n=1 Tax=Jimgerdemannia flammicorona TaxID=994334 RepID=A0A433QMV5_9FUNG|nr:hypothetical protein BC938DRAFT_478418 [Jimgerdemannia flammicorona]